FRLSGTLSPAGMRSIRMGEYPFLLRFVGVLSRPSAQKSSSETAHGHEMGQREGFTAGFGCAERGQAELRAVWLDGTAGGEQAVKPIRPRGDFFQMRPAQPAMIGDADVAETATPFDHQANGRFAVSGFAHRIFQPF